MNLFLDEKGQYGAGDGKLEWVVVNTRQTIHTCDKISSKNPFIIWRMRYLKLLSLKEFTWKKTLFDPKNKSIASCACVLDKDIVPYHGVVTFEEAIKDTILRFVPENIMNFQMIFVFENDVIRCVEFIERQMVSSRLLSSFPQNKDSFIISDQDIPNIDVIKTIDFCGNKTLKNYVLEMDFHKMQNVLGPPVDFPISYLSYHGKVRAKKHILSFGVMGLVGLLMQFQSMSLASRGQNAVRHIQNLESSLGKNETLKQKKNFLKEYLKKGFDKKISIVSHLKEFGFIVEDGFYVHDMRIVGGNKMHMTLKPFTENSQVLSKFQILQKHFKNVKAGVVIHKPPYGLEKGRRKSCSKAKIEVVWGVK